MLEKFDAPIMLSENPMQLATELISEGRMQEVLYLVQFSHQYLPADTEFSYLAIENKASQALDSPLFLAERFVTGAVTGEASDTAGLIGTLTLDLLVIGDIRDLLVQGYKEFDTGQGDEVIMGLSAAGLILTLAPELSWAPSLFKTFWRGNKFSASFQKQLRNTLSLARKTGDYRSLRRMMSHFTETVDSLGTGPAMTVFRQMKSSDDLALLAKKSKIAAAETYTLASINGMKSLQNISTTGRKQGKLLKRVKLATRQQKLFGKAQSLIPLLWLMTTFWISVILFVYIIFRASKQSN